MTTDSPTSAEIPEADRRAESALLDRLKVRINFAVVVKTTGASEEIQRSLVELFEDYEKDAHKAAATIERQARELATYREYHGGPLLDQYKEAQAVIESLEVELREGRNAVRRLLGGHEWNGKDDHPHRCMCPYHEAFKFAGQTLQRESEP